ncbi:MAG: hypothetical protein CM1200mP10_00380 [Candidatus Neomarinimicrobiota bacterium]|nr:MAG: hypothetical protein CM1200mP10_00380 [Candidatus Neomarinimicrobiota bacterium]
MLIALLALYFACGKTFDMLLMMERAPFALDGVVWWGMSAIKVIWVLLFIGFAIKVPVFPFHTWLPLGPRRGAHSYFSGAGRYPAKIGCLWYAAD